MTMVIPVILCGGSGTRLWPLSRMSFPKQFLALEGDHSNQSLFQKAVARIALAIAAINPPSFARGQTLILTNEDHRFLVLDQLRELGNINATLLLEPSPRNTAPALTLAALLARETSVGLDGELFDPILLVTPADQVIADQFNFELAVRDCVALVESDESRKTIAILGVAPRSPETAYGYIKCKQESGVHNEHLVEEFIEKPDLITAKKYLADGSYLWNSGIFVMHASTWLAALGEHCPDILTAVEGAWATKTVDLAYDASFIRPNNEIFQSVVNDSIDYAVIERCVDSKFSIKMVELNAGWSDLGSWDSVWREARKDQRGNAVFGDAIVDDSKNTLVYSTDRLVCVIGVENLAVVEAADAVLISDRSHSQEIKNLVAKLGERGRPEINLHRRVDRPWGWYDTVDQGHRFKVKRILVRPGATLSLQEHQHRAEHWIVVKGVAEITNGDQVILLLENQSTFIPKGQLHRLANPGKQDLEIIEVQSGDYLGEDDIVRHEDFYGRH